MTRKYVMRKSANGPIANEVSSSTDPHVFLHDCVNNHFDFEALTAL
jgi:hypothetical protein